MKLTRTLIPALALLLLLNSCGARNDPQPHENPPPSISASEAAKEQMEPVTEETDPVRESVQETEEASETEPTVPDTTDSEEDTPSEPPAVTEPPKTEPAKPQNPPTEPPATQPPPTEPPATQPPIGPPQREPEPTKLPATEPPEVPPETQPPETEPDPTEPAVTEITYEFKRQVASYAVQYINQYRAEAGVSRCVSLPVMTLVAEYRADQLCWNYSHDTADKREALVYYKYGRWIDATQFGGDPSKSYYEADTSEAICAGFRGTDPEAMGRRIADMIRNSGTHWSYIGKAENIYIGVGVEYRAGSEYEWYGCVMVGPTNYG